MILEKSSILTALVIILTALLIVILCCTAKFITIEKQIKHQLRPPKCPKRQYAINRKHTPLFNEQLSLNKDISQLYYYHDLCLRGELANIPGTIIARIYNTKDKKDAKNSPSCVVFDIEEDSETIRYFIFRCTKTKYEVTKDMDYSQRNGTHKGILDIYSKIEEELLGHIKESNKNILFGHSLGGAIVDILAEHLTRMNKNLWKSCYAISSGSPRVFSPELSMEIEQRVELNRYIKIINEADMVTTLPTSVTTKNGLFSIGKRFFFRGLSNPERIFRFNEVVKRQLIDAHMTSTYSRIMFSSDPYKLPKMFNQIKSI